MEEEQAAEAYVGTSVGELVTPLVNFEQYDRAAAVISLPLKARSQLRESQGSFTDMVI